MSQQYTALLPEVRIDADTPAQSQDPSALSLRTTGSANRAYLEQDMHGRVYLYFRGLRFAVEDFVPNSLVGSRQIAPSVTAGEFVCRQMLRDYGYHEDQWPELARQFLLKHSPWRAAARSRSVSSGRDAPAA